MPSRARWISFVSRQAEGLGWSWAYWQFDSDFVVYDIAKKKWVEPIRDALIPPSSPHGHGGQTSNWPNKVGRVGAGFAHRNPTTG
jgi:hypothetical protein